MSDLLSGKFPSELFANSIVLISPYAAGLSDYVTTSVDRTFLMYGVEFQANVIQQMLRQDFKTEVSDDLQAAALFVISAACLWFFLGRKLGYAVIVWAVAAGGSLLACKGLYGAGFVLHPLWLGRQRHLSGLPSRHASGQRFPIHRRYLCPGTPHL